MNGSGDSAICGLALLVEPVEDVLAPVSQPPPDDEAARTGAQHPPVAQRGDGDADKLGDLLDCQQRVAAGGVTWRYSFIVGSCGLGLVLPLKAPESTRVANYESASAACCK